ncbi:MAG: hypothetical protein SGPRY_013996, partial [Prymnesium sp.]
AVFTWSLDEDGALQAHAFGSLRCAGYSDRSERRTALRLFGGGGGQSEKLARMLPSWSSPTNLQGEVVSSEDDILHASGLPEFGVKMRPHESELLLSYLTLLVAPQLQAVVDASLFEPSCWLPPGMQQASETIPLADRSQLATPAGLLIQARA